MYKYDIHINSWEKREIGFCLGNLQITFFVEDEEGPYYEATAEIVEG